VFLSRRMGVDLTPRGISMSWIGTLLGGSPSSSVSSRNPHFFSNSRMIPLEDEAIDIIAKAQAGQEISDSNLMARVGLSEEQLDRLKKRGGADIHKVAEALRLDGPTLQAICEESYRPSPIDEPGLRQFNSEFGSMRVNAFGIWDAATKRAALFDTGADAAQIFQWLNDEGLRLEALFITHAHRDHVAALEDILTRIGSIPVYIGAAEELEGAEAFESGREFEIGKFRIETRLTWGHSRGGITYVIREGFPRPIAIVGDAVFAGSMGGGRVSYLDALRTNRDQIFSLPDETVLCPGHGPMTTVGEEKLNNPFFANSWR